MALRELQVLVHGQPVARLTTEDGFRHALTYLPDVPADKFVGLAMPVRAESWTWPQMPPFFQVNLPEGFLLSVLKERLGPLLGATPMELLSVVGQNMIGRVSIEPVPDAGAPVQPGASTPGVATSEMSARLATLLHGEHSIERFLELVNEYAASGVSGVVPKFLAPQLAAQFRKASIATGRYILKGSSAHTPFLALNEYLCLKVAQQTGVATASAEISADGQVLQVARFDIASDGSRLGFEDMCSLLGLTPDQKYDTTWERVWQRAADYLAPTQRRAAGRQFATLMLLNYALGNADCHAKNIALLYSGREDVRLAPIYDLLSIRIYPRYVDNAPGLHLGGRKVWTPGRELPLYLSHELGLRNADTRLLLVSIYEAMTGVMPEIVRFSEQLPDFRPWAAHMAYEWGIGVQRIAYLAPTLDAPDLHGLARRLGLEPVPSPSQGPSRIGESPLLGRRGGRRRTPL